MGAGGGSVGPAFSALLGGLPALADRPGEAEGEPFSSRAAVAVVLGIVAEVFLAKQTQLGVGGGVGFGDVGSNARFQAGSYLQAVVRSSPCR